METKKPIRQMDLGERFTECRHLSGLSQEELSKRTGISRATITAIETGIANPSFRILETLLRAMDLSLAEFFESDIPKGWGNTADRRYYEKVEFIMRSDLAGSLRTVVDYLYMGLLNTDRPGVKVVRKKPDN